MIFSMRVFLILSLLLTTKSSVAQTVTFNRDIGPIIQSKCADCHKPNESAPFNLLTYEDVAKRASFIAKVVESKYMPPWKADNTYTHFANNRSLSNEQIKKITDWVKAGAPKGNERFSEIAQLSGISNTDWSWSALFADLDNDGWKDLFITNGYLRDFTNLYFLIHLSN